MSTDQPAVVAIKDGGSFWDDLDTLRRCLAEETPRILQWTVGTL